MTTKQLTAILLLTLFPFTFLSAKEVAGVSIPDQYQQDITSPLILNGTGIRTKWFMDLYVGALYLKEHSTDAEKIITDDNAMAIRLHMVSNLVTSEKMTKATLEGFDNATHGNTAPIQGEIDSFIANFKEPIRENDIFDLVYVPNTGIKIYKNGELKNTVTGKAFKQALFGIWLSDRPAQSSLKDGMLGK